MTTEQELVYETLKAFSDICKRHQLHFCLVGGSLIGAVRHHGFIPWDDDIDVAMPLEDYIAFLKVADELPEGFELISQENNDDYPYCNVKIFNQETRTYAAGAYKGLGVPLDVFPFVPSREPAAVVRILYDINCVLGYVLQVKKKWIPFVPYKKRFARYAFTCLSLFPATLLASIQKKINETISMEGTDYYFSPGGCYKSDKEFYKKEWFSETIQMKFEDAEFPAPIGWHEYLSRNYGSYMEYPPDMR